MKYNDNGTFKDIYVKASDTLPIGTEVDYDGNTVPSGWEEVTPNMKVLWTNPNPTASTFAAQSITLDESIDNYSYYEIIYKRTSSSDFYYNTSKIPSNLATRMSMSEQYNYYRVLTSLNNTNMTFDDCYYFSTPGSSTTTVNNAILIPYQVIGYK